MPAPKRPRREPTHEWGQIQQRMLWPEQEWYEKIRPMLLFGQTAGERAKETNDAQRTLARKADEFERSGMASLFAREQPAEKPHEKTETARSLPEELRQLIVDLHAEYPPMSWREIAEICYIRYNRRPSHHSVKQVIATGPPPSLKARRYQPWEMIPDPAERRLAVIRLHAEGWSISSIARYLETSRPTIYATLKRWMEEGVAGLEDKSRARKAPRKATLPVRNEIRKLQENPLLGKFRMHAALLRDGIEVSPATCARIMASNHQLYGMHKPPRAPRPKLEMPFRARRRHEYWSAGAIRFA
jgi:putative transposase